MDIGFNTCLKHITIVIYTFLFAAYALPDTIITKKSITLTDGNWHDILVGEWMIEFKAPWCPACQVLSPAWEKLAGWKEEFEMNVGDIDVTTNPSLSGRFLVTSLPTIYHIKDGIFRQYVGSREEGSLISLVAEKKWRDIEPVKWWFNPTYPQMACLGFIFKMSLYVREFYNMMVHDYGISEWTCYIIFAVATIVAGLLLGLVFVILCDFMFPPRPAPPPPPPRPEQDDGNESDILDDTKTGDGDVHPSVRKRFVEKSDE